MFSSVVVGIDFSPGGEALLKSLEDLRRLGTTRVTLVHAVDIPFPITPIDRTLASYREALLSRQRVVEDLGFEVTAELLVGEPAVEIARFAELQGAGLILLGSRGESRLREAFLGSVAWGVLRNARVPVLIRRIEPGLTVESPFEAQIGDGFEKVLYATDWSGTSERAFRHVEALAREGRIPRFELIHVRSQIDEARTGQSEIEPDTRALRELAERLQLAGASRVDIETPSGAPFVEIVRRAGPGTLIIMGTRARHVLSSAFLGSVSHEVARTTNAAVLLVPPGLPLADESLGRLTSQQAI